MNKLITAATLGVSLVVASHAATFTSQTFLAPGITSLGLTNLIGATNLNSGTIRSNTAGLTYTNASPVTISGVDYPGSQVIVSNDAALAHTKNLFADVALWTGADGQPILNPVSDAAGIVTNSSMASFYVRLVGQSGANATVNFLFVPLPDGEHESTVAGDAFNIAVTAVASSVTDKTVWLPTWKWPGVGKIRLKSATNTDTDATSRVDVLQCSLNGFIP